MNLIFFSFHVWVFCFKSNKLIKWNDFKIILCQIISKGHQSLISVIYFYRKYFDAIDYRKSITFSLNLILIFFVFLPMFSLQLNWRWNRWQLYCKSSWLTLAEQWSGYSKILSWSQRCQVSYNNKRKNTIFKLIRMMLQIKIEWNFFILKQQLLIDI